MMVMLWGSAGTVLAETLSIQQAIEQGLLNNPGIERQRQQVQSGQLEQSIAQARRLPELEFQAGVTHYSDPTLVWPIHEPGQFPPFDDDVVNVGINFRLPLYLGGKLVSSVDLAEKMTRSAELGLQASRQELIFNIVSVYGKTLQLLQLREAMRHRIANLESRLEDVQRLQRTGRAAAIDVARINTRLSEARYEMASLEQGVASSRELLGTLMGTAEVTQELEEFPPLKALPFSTLAQWMEQALASHPQLARAHTAIQAAEHRTDIARSERLPQVNVIGNSRHLESGEGDGQDEWQLGLQLTLPLFDGSVRRDQVSQAEIARQMAQLELQELRDSIRYQVSDAHGAVRTDRLQLRVAEQGLREAEEVYRIEQLRHRTGTSTMTDLLGAEADLWNARAKQTQATYDLVISESRLRKVAGLIAPQQFVQD